MSEENRTEEEKAAAQAATLASMDEAAALAAKALEAMSPDVVKPMYLFWKENYAKAGHKRLAKTLLALGKKQGW
jgi:hypothetical protein